MYCAVPLEMSRSDGMTPLSSKPAARKSIPCRKRTRHSGAVLHRPLADFSHLANRVRRASLSKSLKAYVKNHYPGGACAVCCSARPLRRPAPVDGTTASREATAGTEEPKAIEIPAEATTGADGVTVEVEKEEDFGKEEEPIETPTAVEAPVETTDVPEPTTEDDAESASKGIAPGESTADASTSAAEAASMETPAAAADEGEQAADGDAPAEETSAPVEETPTTVEQAPVDPLAAPSSEGPVLSTQTESAPDAVVEEDIPAEPTVFTVQIVSNKYNVANFWLVADDTPACCLR